MPFFTATRGTTGLAILTGLTRSASAGRASSSALEGTSLLSEDDAACVIMACRGREVLSASASPEHLYISGRQGREEGATSGSGGSRRVRFNGMSLVLRRGEGGTSGSVGDWTNRLKTDGAFDKFASDS